MFGLTIVKDFFCRIRIICLDGQMNQVKMIVESQYACFPLLSFLYCFRRSLGLIWSLRVSQTDVKKARVWFSITTIGKRQVLCRITTCPNADHKHQKQERWKHWNPSLHHSSNRGEWTVKENRRQLDSTTPRLEIKANTKSNQEYISSVWAHYRLRPRFWRWKTRWIGGWEKRFRV